MECSFCLIIIIVIVVWKFSPASSSTSTHPLSKLSFVIVNCLYLFWHIDWRSSSPRCRRLSVCLFVRLVIGFAGLLLLLCWESLIALRLFQGGVSATATTIDPGFAFYYLFQNRPFATKYPQKPLFKPASLHTNCHQHIIPASSSSSAERV